MYANEYTLHIIFISLKILNLKYFNQAIMQVKSVKLVSIVPKLLTRILSHNTHRL